MSSVRLSGNASGTGILTVTSPNTNTNYTLTLPAATTTIVGTDATQSFTNKSFDSASVPTVTGTMPLYFCRAWVNFNGTGTVAIRGSGNVSSITDNGTGNYYINFSTAMPDANYAATATNNLASNGAWYVNPYIAAQSTTIVQYVNYSSYTPNLNGADADIVNITVFR